MSPRCRGREGGRWEGATDLEDWTWRFKEAGLPQKRGFSPVHVGVLKAQHFYVSGNFFLVICFMIIQQLDKTASQATSEAMYKNQPCLFVCLFVLLKKSIPALFFRPALKQHSAISKNLKSTLKASTLAPLELLERKKRISAVAESYTAARGEQFTGDGNPLSTRGLFISYLKPSTQVSV